MSDQKMPQTSAEAIEQGKQIVAQILHNKTEYGKRKLQQEDFVALKKRIIKTAKTEIKLAEKNFNESEPIWVEFFKTQEANLAAMRALHAQLLVKEAGTTFDQLTLSANVLTPPQLTPPRAIQYPQPPPEPFHLPS